MKKMYAVLIALASSLVLLVAYNLSSLPIISMLRSASDLELKTAELISKASAFDKAEALSRYDGSGPNMPYYRFDRNLNRALFDQTSFPAFNADPGKSLCMFDFSVSDDSSLIFHNADYTVQKGTCSITTQLNALIENANELGLVKDNLSEIEIRLKSSQGRQLFVGLSSYPDAQWSKRRDIVDYIEYEAFSKPLLGICTIPIDIIADNSFHTYTINIENTLSTAWVDFDDMIRKFFISLPDISGNKIEIDYIRFISKKDKFSRRPFGTAYVDKGRELRSVLYMNSPGVLRYRLDIPSNAPFLSFGTGVLELNDPVEFTISIIIDGTEQTLFQKTQKDPDGWSFDKLCLADYAGKTADFVFRTSSHGGNIAFWSNPLLYTIPEDSFNVVIVVEDALRPDHLSLYGYTERDTSPFREKFSQDGVVFDNAFSQATATRPSVPSYMTSLYPTAAGVGLEYEKLNDNYLTLAEIMRSRGFATAFVNQNPNAGYYNGMHQGFGRLYDLESRVAGLSSTADVYGEHLLSWLDDIRGRNFFLYLHVLDPHGPYNPPPPYDEWYRQADLSDEVLEINPAADPAWVKAPTRQGRRLLYDGAIRNNDYWFEEFHKTLASRGLLENTLIIFMSDHGEFLGERGMWCHEPPGYPEGIRVPLIMAYPKKLPVGKRISDPVQLLDIMPTVLDIAGIELDNLVLQGDSLLSLIDGSNSEYWKSRICFSEEVVRRGYKFDRRPFGSIIINNWHLLNSKEFLPAKLRQRHSRLEPLLFQAFHTSDDITAHRFGYAFYGDPLSKYFASRIMQKFHDNNHRLFDAFSIDEARAITVDPLVQEKLRGLGYLQ
jgi:arylsulfatase A-like enzyme